MGKSNKFDYTNRGSSGKRLGEIIGGALQKEAEKVKKDAERLAQKVRKRNDANSSSTIESPTTTHSIDLIAPGKALGDEGVFALAEGLELALKAGTPTASLALEDLNLSHNGITVASLACLAPILELARSDMKALDISGNPIMVENESQANQWETFLRSLNACNKIRRLAMSGNIHFGSKAFEIFAKIHWNESAADKSRRYEGSTPATTNESESDNEDLTDAAAQESSLDDAELSKDRIERQDGLRLIPCILFNDVGLTDSDALWLSFVIQDHPLPAQLLDGLNVSSAEVVSKESQHDAQSLGIKWTGDNNLSKDGLLLLEKMEAFRRNIQQSETFDTASSKTVDDINTDEVVSSTRKAGDEKISPTTPGNRRTSLTHSNRTGEVGTSETADIDSLRRKIQRHVIAERGARSVELWQAALKLFVVARLVLFVAPSRKDSNIESHPEQVVSDHHSPPISQPPAPKLFSHMVQPPTPNPKNNLTGPTTSPAVTIAPAATDRYVSHQRARSDHLMHLAPGRARNNSEVTIKDVTNTHRNWPTLHNPKGHQGPSDKEPVDDTYPTRPLRTLSIKQDSNTASSTPATTTKSITLPENVVEHIASFILSEREMMVIGDTQRRIAIQQGQDRGSLAVEKEWSRLGESAQVWMLLDSIDCLAYRK